MILYGKVSEIHQMFDQFLIAFNCGTALDSAQIFHQLCVVSVTLNCSVQTLYSSVWLCVDSVQTKNGSVQALCRLSIALYRFCVDRYGSVQTLRRPRIAVHGLCVDLYCSVQTLCRPNVHLFQQMVPHTILLIVSNTRVGSILLICGLANPNVGFSSPNTWFSVTNSWNSTPGTQQPF